MAAHEQWRVNGSHRWSKRRSNGHWQSSWHDGWDDWSKWRSNGRSQSFWEDGWDGWKGRSDDPRRYDGDGPVLGDCGYGNSTPRVVEVDPKLKEFAKSLPRGDSFTACLVDPKLREAAFVDETSQKTGRHRSAVLLPPQSPVARQMPWSGWKRWLQDARSEANRCAMALLQRTGGPLHEAAAPVWAEDEAASEADAACPIAAAAGACASESAPLASSTADPIGAPTRAPTGSLGAAAGRRESLPEELRLFAIRERLSGRDGDCSFGFFLVNPTDAMWYAWTFGIESDHDIDVYPVSFASRMGDQIRVDERNESILLQASIDEDVLLKYHNAVAADWSIAQSGFFMLVRLKQGIQIMANEQDTSIDILDRELMNIAPTAFPGWLPRVLTRWHTLGRVEASMVGISPLLPVPNPASVEAALFGGCSFFGHADLNDFEAAALRDAFEELKAVGKLVSNVYAVTNLVCRCGEASERLGHRLRAENSDARLAKLAPRIRTLVYTVLKSCGHCQAQLDSVWESLDAGTCIGVAHALLGALFKADGGGFGQVAKLLQYLLQEKQDPSTTAAAAHLLSGQGGECHFEGQTPTYQSFRQIILSGEPVLRVEYESRHNAGPASCLYRRAEMGVRKRPQEKWMCDGEWTDVLFCPLLGTYLSSNLKKQGEAQPLANKISAWLDGRLVASLVNQKHNNNKAAVQYQDLQECCLMDGELELHVVYADYGRFVYRACPDGNLGFERVQAGPEEPLIYSEAEKTLLSPLLSERLGKPAALPNKVVAWLRGSNALAQLVQCQSTAIKSEGEDLQASNIEEHDDYVCFASDQRWFLQRGSTGLTYCYGTSRDQGYLRWRESLKQWVSPSETTVVPSAVQGWLHSRAHDELCKAHPTCENFMLDFLRKPWRATPPHLKRFLPKEVELGMLQHDLNYVFRNPMLLAEALTHSSCVESNTPCNDRLSFLGMHVIEALISTVLGERLCFGGAHATAWSPTAERKAGERRRVEQALRIESHRELNAWRKACCNHLAYACSAVKLQLQHRGFKTASEALRQGITEFDQLLQRLEAHREGVDNPWLFIVQHGAPRALGDAFLAVAGAVYLDSSWRQTTLALRPFIVDAHVDFCQPLSKLLVEEERTSVTCVTTADALPPSDVQDLVREDVRLTAAAAPLDDVSARQQVCRAFELTDFHACAIGQNEQRRLARSCSPGAAYIKALLAHELPDLRDLPSLPPHDAECSECHPSGSGGHAPDAPPGAIHCEDCDMWLNGPIQWEDHKIGKKHTNNVIRGKAAVSTATAKRRPKKGSNAQTPVAPDPIIALQDPPWEGPSDTTHSPYPPYPYPYSVGHLPPPYGHAQHYPPGYYYYPGVPDPYSTRPLGEMHSTPLEQDNEIDPA